MVNLMRRLLVLLLMFCNSAWASVLDQGASLASGSELRSSNGTFRLAMQLDGNLVFSRVNGATLWSSGTQGNAGARAVMQADGNFVVFSSAGMPLWSTGTSNTSPQDRARLKLQDDGNVVIYARRPVWATYTARPSGTFTVTQGTSGMVFPPLTLAGSSQITSANGQFRLLMQSGNLVLQQKSAAQVHWFSFWGPLWTSPTAGQGAYAAIQNDGNLVVYGANGVPVWASGSSNLGGASFLWLQEDGNLVMHTDLAKWSSFATYPASSPTAGQTVPCPTGTVPLNPQTCYAPCNSGYTLVNGTCQRPCGIVLVGVVGNTCAP
jgi:pseudomonalisin